MRTTYRKDPDRYEELMRRKAELEKELNKIERELAELEDGRDNFSFAKAKQLLLRQAYFLVAFLFKFRRQA